MSVRLGAIVVAIAVLSTALPAQTQSVAEKVWADVEHVPGDMLHVYSAPFRIDADDLPAIAAFTGVALLTFSFDGEIQQLVRDHPNSLVIEALTPWREPSLLSKFGSTPPLVMLSGALYATGLATGSSDLREAGFGCATADVTNSLFREVLYATVTRVRPKGETDPYQFDFPGGPWEHHSFFGGHAANPMSCASFINHRFELGFFEPALYVLAGGIGLARLPDEAHWASDTLVGLAFGFGVGKLIADRYAERADAASDSAGSAGSGVQVSGSLRLADGNLSIFIGPWSPR